MGTLFAFVFCQFAWGLISTLELQESRYDSAQQMLLHFYSMEHVHATELELSEDNKELLKDTQVEQSLQHFHAKFVIRIAC